MNGSNLVTGSVAGAVLIQAFTTLDGTLSTADDVVSQQYEVDIWGPPAQIVTVAGPLNYNPQQPWTLNEFPSAISPYTVPPSQFLPSQFVPNSLTAPTADVCYFYVASIDVSGVGWYRKDAAVGKLYGNATVIPAGTKNLTAHWAAPLGYGGVALPGSPTGLFGEQCVVLTWGPPPGDNASVTLEYKGTWFGIADANIPPVTAGVPYDITREIRILHQ